MDCRPSPEEGAWRYEVMLREFFARPFARPASTSSCWVWGTTATPPPRFPVPRRSPSRSAGWRRCYVPQQELHRLTLTAPLINGAAAIAFLVAGAAKEAVVREVIQGPRDPLRLPAQLINPQPGALYWLLDRAAAGALSREYLRGQVDSG